MKTFSYAVDWSWDKVAAKGDDLMCFTVFGLTFSIVRATPVATDTTWYPGAERFDADHFLNEARNKGNILYQMH